MELFGCFAAADVATLKQLRADPAHLEEFLYPDDGGEPPHYRDVNQSWDCIHFMLAGSYDAGVEPLSWAVLGGEKVGRDLGYGPARILDPQQVRSVAAALLSVDEAGFKALYDPQAMNNAGIYRSDICVREGEGALEYLLQDY